MESKKIIESCLRKPELGPDEIPDIDLYMDQILSLVNSKLAPDDENVITKTMINNYSKAKVIQPVKGKKYTKQQILQMLLVYDLKNNLAIKDIKETLDPIYENESDLIEIYREFIDSKANLAEDASVLLNSIVDTSSLEKKLISMLRLSYLADSIKQIMESIK